MTDADHTTMMRGQQSNSVDDIPSLESLNNRSVPPPASPGGGSPVPIMVYVVLLVQGP